MADEPLRIGEIVLFKLVNGPHADELRPAMVVRVGAGSTEPELAADAVARLHGELRVMLAVFTCGQADGAAYARSPTIVSASLEPGLGPGMWRRC